MTLWQTPTVSVFSHDFMTNHGVLEGVTIHTGDEGYDVIGSGMIRVPVNAANVAQIERNRIIVAVTQSSLTAGDLIYPAFFIIKNMQYVVADGKTQIEVTGPGLLEELNRRSIGKNIIAGLVEATLASTVEPVEVATTLASTASGGATSVVVSDATSFAVGQTIEITLDVGGSRHNSRITSVVSTTIGIENSLPSDATAGNAVSTHTGFILSVTVTAGAFEPGHPAHITLDDGTIHAGTIAEYTPGSPGTLRILEGLPSIATSGNDVFQYTSVGVDAVTELMTGYAPTDWTVSITAASTEAMLFGGNESVFEALLQIGKQVRGHFRYVPDPQGTRVLEWLDTPDTMDITNFRMPNTAELPTLDANDAIIESIRQDKSEQAAQVTRIYPQGAMGLDISRAENFVTPNANFTVDWAGGFIVNTTAESGGAPRVDKFVPFEHIQATGSTEGELTQASIVLYQAAEQWLEDREEDDPIFYECTVQVHKPLKPYATVHVAYVADSPGLVINDTLIIQGFTYEMGLDNILRAHVRLSNIEAFRQEGDSNFLATHVQRVDNALRHMGTFSSAQSSILASVPVTRNIIAGIGLIGGGSLLHDVTIALNTPGTVSLSSTNLQGPNHTHEFDETGLLSSAVTLTAGAGLTGGGDLTANRTFDVGQGAGITVNANDVALTTPGTITSTSTNASAGNHTHAIDTTIALSAVTLTAGAGLTGGGNLTANRTFNVGAGGGITVNADDVALTTPGTITSTSTNSSSGNHTHAINATIATSANTVTAGNGLTGGGAITSNPTITLGGPGTLSVSSNNGVSATSHTHNITTSSAVTTATAVIMATDSSGYHQLLRLGAGIAPTVPLHASSAINGSALQVEAPSLTNSVAMSIQNLPLSTGVGDGKGLEIKAGGDDYARLMMYSSGMIGMGPGTATRDVLLDRPAANTFRISSDGGSGTGHLRLNDEGSIGLGPTAGRIVFDNQTVDQIEVLASHLLINGQAPDTNLVGSPSTILTALDGRMGVSSSGDSATLFAYGYGTNIQGGLSLRGARGTRASPTATRSGDDIGRLGAGGHTGSAFVASGTGFIHFSATQDWTASNQGTKIEMHATRQGTSTPTRIVQADHDVGVRVGDGTSSMALLINGAAGQARNLVFETAGLNRWAIRTDNIAESGSNAGSELRILNYTDAGSLVSNVMSFRRSDGAVQVGSPTGGFKGAATLNVQGGVYDNNTLLTDHILDLYYDGRMRPEDAARYPDARLWTIQETADFTRAHHHLPTMPGRDEWAKGSRSLGAMVTALWETVEQQQIQIYELWERAYGNT